MRKEEAPEEKPKSWKEWEEQEERKQKERDVLLLKKEERERMRMLEFINL